jgi:hypothetical protein
MVFTKSALAFPVLLLCCDEDAFPGVGVVVGVGVALHVELSVPGPHPDVGVGTGVGVGVALHVELSVPGPHPDVGVGGGGVWVAAGAHAGSLGFAVQSTPGAGGVAAFPVLLLSCAFAVAANIPSVRIPATIIGKIINAIGLCTISCKNDYNLIRLSFKGVRYRFSGGGGVGGLPW